MRNQQKDKYKFLDELVKSGIVLHACSKTKIPRATVYRWRLEDEEFKKLFDKCMHLGKENLVDMARSVVYKHLVVDKSLKAAELVLKHNDPDYFPKKPEAQKRGFFDNLADVMKNTLRKKHSKNESESDTKD